MTVGELSQILDQLDQNIRVFIDSFDRHGDANELTKDTTTISVRRLGYISRSDDPNYHSQERILHITSRL